MKSTKLAVHSMRQAGCGPGHRRLICPQKVTACVGLALAYLLVTGVPATAANVFWEGGGLDDHWTNTANWLIGNAPGTTDNDDVIFNLSTFLLTSEANLAYQINSLTFNPVASPYTVSGQQLTIDAGGVLSEGVNPQIVNNSILLAAAQTWRSDTGAGTITFGGNVDNGGFDLDLQGVGDKIVVNGGISGLGGATISDDGLVQFGGAEANTYTGNTTIGFSALLELNKSAVDGAIAGNLDLLGGGEARLLANEQIAQTAGNKVTLLATSTLNLNGFSETIRDLEMQEGASVSGTGTLTVLGDIEMTGAAVSTPTIASSTLDLGGGTRTFDTANGAVAVDMDVTAAITNGSVEKTGTGTLRLSGAAANTYAGTTTVSDGTLELNKTAGLNAIAGDLTVGNGTATDIVRLLAANQINDGSTIAIGTSGILDLNGNTERVANIAITGGTVQGPGTLVVGSNVDGLASTATATIGSTTLNLGGTTTTFDIAQGTAVDDMEITAAVANGSVLKTGAGSLKLSGTAANTYTGTTAVNEGTLLLDKAAGVVAIAGNLDVGDGTGTDVVRLNANEQITSAAGTVVAVNSSGQLDLNGFDETINSLTGDGSVTLGTGTLTVGAGGENSNFSGVISGDGNVIKSGAGEFEMSGSADNTYTGTTTVNEGTLVLFKIPPDGAIRGDLVIGDGVGADVVRLDRGNQIVHGAATASVTVNSSGILDLNGRIEQISNLTMSAGTVTTVTGGGGFLTVDGTITTNAASASSTIAGISFVVSPLSGSATTFAVADGAAAEDLVIDAQFATIAGVNKSGAGTMVFQGLGNYTADTTVEGGTLLVNNTTGSGTGSGDVFVQSGATLGGTGTISGAVDVQGGTVAPGNSEGQLNVGSLTMDASSIFEVEIGGTTPGSGYDVLAVAATADVGGNLNVALTGSFLDTIDNSDSFSVLTSAAPVTGSFANAADTARVDIDGSAGSFLVRYGAGGDPNDVILSDFTLDTITSTWDGGTGAWTTDNWTEVATDPGGPVYPDNNHPPNIRRYNAVIETGTVELGIDIELNKLTLDATIDGAHSITVFGPINWSGGSIRGGDAGDEVTVVGGTLDGGTKTLDHKLVNVGTLDWSEGDVVGIASHVGTIQNDATWNITSTENRNTAQFELEIVNNGMIRKSGSSDVTINAPLENDGTLIVEAGTLEIRNDRDGSQGDFEVFTGALLEFRPHDAPHVVEGDLTGLGEVRVLSQTVEAFGAVDLGTLKISGGNFKKEGTAAHIDNLTVEGFDALTGGADVHVSNNLQWTSGTLFGGVGANLLVEPGATAELRSSSPKFLNRTLVNQGNLDWSDGLIGSTGGQFTNGAGGVFNMTTTGGLHDVDADIDVTNRLLATINRNGGSLARVSGTLNNEGEFNGLAGDFRSEDTNNSGTFDITAGTFNLRSFEQTAGILRVHSGAIVDSNTTMLISGGRVEGNGEFDAPNVRFTSGAVLAPGLSTGTLTTENLNFFDGAIYEWELGLSGAYDSVDAEVLTFESTAILKLIDAGGQPDFDNAYVLFSYTGNDPTNPLWTIDGSMAPLWDISGASVFVDPLGNQVILTGLVGQNPLGGGVPEPSTALLTSFSTILIMRRRRFARARQHLGASFGASKFSAYDS